MVLNFGFKFVLYFVHLTGVCRACKVNCVCCLARVLVPSGGKDLLSISLGHEDVPFLDAKPEIAISEFIVLSNLEYHCDSLL